ncbi:MAG: protein kinase [Myxococcales bacterium]|nr:protein kinase [Myxococcales bacterium]
MTTLPESLGLTVLDGPRRVGSELRWRVLDAGEPAVLGQLLPELARDASLRRRYVRDVERLAELGGEGLARVRRRGPQPDPRDLAAPPPWRLRDDPPGETLEAWLERRAPAPIDEAAAVVEALARRIHRLHAHGAVIRDLNPRHVVLGEDGQPWLTDVGLARVDVLSTRTAASLLLEASPYAAPELLARTVVDQRADLYGLGVILFRAITGSLPHGDEPSLLRPPGPPPRLRAARSEAPSALDELVARCLAEDPALRPGSAAEIADALQGTAALPELDARVPCQACGHALRPGQRLCTHCGKLAVQFLPAPEGERGLDVELRAIDEHADSRARLHDILSAVADGPLPPLNFLVGDSRMYSKGERERFIKLPVALVRGLGPDSANALDARLRDAGLKTRISSADRGSRALTRRERVGLVLGGSAALAVAVGVGVVVGNTVGWITALVLLTIATFVLVGAAIAMRRRKTPRNPEGLIRVRPSPAALPASDPLVARLGALLQDDPPADLREQIGELALAVQRLVDHRARNLAEAEEIDAVTAPVARLVELVEAQVRAIRGIDAELARLDEGALVRALAAAEARGEPEATREELLQGLDRLRALEDARARRFHRLLEAARLARRAVELGLAVHDPKAEHERQVALALASLEHDELDAPEGSEPAALPEARGAAASG